jgi:VWFA-related protein
MRAPRFFSILSAVAISLLAVPATAQQSLGDNSVTSPGASSRQVFLPLITRDKHGDPVMNLAATDVSLSVDGRPQPIESLKGGNVLPIQIGLLIDTSRGMLKAMDSERKAAAKFVDLTLPADASGTTPRNEAFLLHFDREAELLEDFTASREKLAKDLEQLGPSERTENTEGPETADSDSGYGGRRNFRAASPQLYDAIYLAANELMKKRHGRKALIVFSNGVDAGSKESLIDAIEAAERAGTPVYTIFFKGEEAAAERAFPGGGRRGGPGGWPGGGGGPGGRGGRGARLPQVDGKKIMAEIAARTGGLSFEARKTAELEEIYSRIAADARAQYLLAFTPKASSSDTEYHKIGVKADRTDLALTAPEGFYAELDSAK